MGVGFPAVGVQATVLGAGAFVGDMARMSRATNATVSTISSASARINSASLGPFQRVTNAALELGSAIQSVGRSMSLIGTTLTFTASLPIAAGLIAATKAGAEFEEQLTRLFTLGGLNGGVMDPKIYEYVKRSIQDIAIATGILTTEITRAAYEGYSVGLSLSQGMRLAQRAAELARVSGTDIKDISRALSFAFTNNLEPGVNALELIDYLANTLFITVREGAFELESFGAGFNKVYALAKLAGATPIELFSLSAGISTAGIPNESITTALNQIFRQFISPTPEFEEAILAAGYTWDEFKAKVADTGFLDTLIEIRDVMGEKLFYDIFSQRAIAGAVGPIELDAVMRNTLDTYRQIDEETKALAEAFAAQMQTVQGQTDILRASWQVFGQTIYDAIKPQLIEILGQINSKLFNLIQLVRDNPETTQMFVKIAAGIAALGPALLILGQVVRSIGLLANVVVIPLQLVGKLAGAFVGIGRLAVGLVAPAFNLVNRSLGVFSAIWVKTLSLVANGAYLLVKPFSSLKNLSGGLMDLSRSLGRVAYSSLSSGLISALSGLGPVISQALSSTVGGLAGIGKSIKKAIAPIFSGAGAALKDKKFLETIVKNMDALHGGLMKRLKAINTSIRGALSSMRVALAGGIARATSAMQGAFSALSSSLARATARISAQLVAFGSAIALKFSGIVRGFLSSGIGSVFTKFASTFTRGISSLATKFTSVISAQMYRMISSLGATTALRLGIFGLGLRNKLTFIFSSFEQLPDKIGLLLGGLGQRISGALGGVSGAFGKLGQVASTAMGAIGTAIRAALPVIGTGLGVIGKMLGSVGSAAVGAAAKVATSVFTMGLKIQGTIIVAGALAGAIALAFNKVKGVAEDLRQKTGKTFGDMATDLKSHGRNIIQQFGEGMIQGAIAVVEALQYIADIITYWLAPGSPPRLLPELTNWGSGALAAYMEGWTVIDLNLFKDLSDTFRSYLESIFSGEDADLTINRTLTTINSLIGKAISELNEYGDATEETLNQIYDAVSGGTIELQNYVDAMFELAVASERVKNIQQQIADINYRYDEKLLPLNQAYDRLERERSAFSAATRLDELDQIINDPRVVGFARDLALIERQQLLIDRQRNNIERDRAEELDPLQQQLQSAQRQEELAQAHLDVMQAIFNLQVDQNKLLQDIAKADKDKQEKKDKGSGLPELDPSLRPEGLDANLAEGIGGALEAAQGELDRQKKILEQKFDELKQTVMNIIADIGFRLRVAWIKYVLSTYYYIINHPVYEEIKAKIQTIIDIVKELFDIGSGGEGTDLVNVLQKVADAVLAITNALLTGALTGITWLDDLLTTMGALASAFGENAGQRQALDEQYIPQIDALDRRIENSTFWEGIPLRAERAELVDDYNSAINDLNSDKREIIIKGIVYPFLNVSGAGLDVLGSATGELLGDGEDVQGMVGGLDSISEAIRNYVRSYGQLSTQSGGTWLDRQISGARAALFGWGQEYTTFTEGIKTRINEMWVSIFTSVKNGAIGILQSGIEALGRFIELLSADVVSVVTGIGTFLSGIWGSFVAALDTVVSTSTLSVTTLRDVINAKIEEINKKWEDFKTKLGEIGTAISTFVTEKTEAFLTWKDSVVEYIGNIIDDALEVIATWLADNAEKFTTWLTDRATEFDTFKTAVVTAITEAVDAFVTKVGEMWQSASEKIQPIITWIGNLLTKLQEMYDWAKTHVVDFKINWPWFAASDSPIPMVTWIDAILAKVDEMDGARADLYVGTDLQELAAGNPFAQQVDVLRELAGADELLTTTPQASLMFGDYLTFEQLLNRIRSQMTELERGAIVPIRLVSDRPIVVNRSVTFGDTNVDSNIDINELERRIHNVVLEMVAA